MLKNIICSCATHRGLELKTTRSIVSCSFGAVQIVEGIADLALARCVQLTRARNAAKRTGQTHILVVDDDIVFAPQDVMRLYEFCDDIVPISGCYEIGNQVRGWRTAADPMGDGWLTGFGFMLIPVAGLDKIEPLCQPITWDGEDVTAWCVSGPMNNDWIGEDYDFCMRFGSIHLQEDVKVGHIKKLIVGGNRWSEGQSPAIDSIKSKPLTDRD